MPDNLKETGARLNDFEISALTEVGDNAHGLSNGACDQVREEGSRLIGSIPEAPHSQCEQVRFSARSATAEWQNTVIMIPAFVINLESRPDRAAFAVAECERVGIDVRFVSATTGSDLPTSLLSMTKLSAARAACWASHRKVWALGAELTARYFLVLEDDTRWLQDPKPALSEIASGSSEDFDILQLGSLMHGPEGLPLRVRAATTTARTLRMFRRISTRAQRAEVWLTNQSQLIAQAVIEENASSALSSRVDWGSFGSGTHAYVVNRTAVAHLLAFNYPPFLAADDALSALAHQRTFRIGRLREGIATQAPWPSDIR